MASDNVSQNISRLSQKVVKFLNNFTNPLFVERFHSAWKASEGLKPYRVKGSTHTDNTVLISSCKLSVYGCNLECRVSVIPSICQPAIGIREKSDTGGSLFSSVSDS